MYNVALAIFMMSSVAILQCVEEESFVQPTDGIKVDRQAVDKIKEKYAERNKSISDRQALNLMYHAKTNADLTSTIDSLKDSSSSSKKLSWFGKVVDKVNNYMNKRSLSSALINHAKSSDINPPVLTEEQSKAFEKLSAKDKQDLANTWKEEHERSLISKLKNEKNRYANNSKNYAPGQHQANAEDILISHDLKTNSFSNWLKNFSSNEPLKATTSVQSKLFDFTNSLKDKNLKELASLGKQYPDGSAEKNAILNEIKLQVKAKYSAEKDLKGNISETSSTNEVVQSKTDFENVMENFGYKKPVEPTPQPKDWAKDTVTNLLENFTKDALVNSDGKKSTIAAEPVVKAEEPVEEPKSDFDSIFKNFQLKQS